jgi:NDP-sugar pyrophosphorylase family protein
MKAVIMAGGLGQRLKPLTKVIPKPLLPIGEKSVLEITINHLKECGCNEIFVALNYQSSLFEAFLSSGQWGIKIQCSKEEIPLGTAGPLKLFTEKLDEPFLVINGDILTDLDFRELKKFHTEQQCALTLVTKAITMPLRYGIVQSENNKIVALQEKPDVSVEVVAGIYFCNPSILEDIPAGQYFTMIDLIHFYMNHKKELATYHLTNYWLDVGNMEDYEKAQDLYHQGAFDINNKK